jgi:flagellar basal-body rod modification protein FlgD
MQPTEIQSLTQPSFAETNTEKPETTIGRDDFLRMLVAQLENQDPLNPQDPSEFTAQLATFSTLEQQIGIRSGVDELVRLQTGREDADSTASLLQSLTATSMVGREVLAAASHFELKDGDDGQTLRFELAAIAPDVRIEIRDARGALVDVIEDDEIAPDNQALAQGPQQLQWDGKNLSDNDAAPGVYQYEVIATNGNDAVPAQPLLTGLVTGAGMGSEPLLFLGEVAIPLSSVIEVRQAPEAR